MDTSSPNLCWGGDRFVNKVSGVEVGVGNYELEA